MEWRPDIQRPSIGGDVADLFGNLERLETKEKYRDSTNPKGDRFAGMNSAGQMIETFAQAHPSELGVLDQRLDNFFGVNENAPGKVKPKIYLEAKAALQGIKENEKEAHSEKPFLAAVELALLPVSDDPEQERVNKGMRTNGLTFLGADENKKYLDKYLGEGKMKDKLVDLLMDNFEHNLEGFDKPERFHNPLGFTVVQSIYIGLGLEHAKTDAGKRIYRLAWARSMEKDAKKAVGILKTLPETGYLAERFQKAISLASQNIEEFP